MQRPEFIAIGRLSRDLLLLAQGTEDQVQIEACLAVNQGRAAEVFVLAVAGYYNEQKGGCDPSNELTGGQQFLIDEQAKIAGTASPSTPARPESDVVSGLVAEAPALNPASGEQPEAFEPKEEDPSREGTGGHDGAEATRESISAAAGSDTTSAAASVKPPGDTNGDKVLDKDELKNALKTK